MERIDTKVEITRLEPLTIYAPKAPDTKRAVLFLHGMGERGPMLAEDHFDIIKNSGRTWILPNGPFPWERRRLGRLGYSWYFFLGNQQLLKTSMFSAIEYLKKILAEVQLKLPVHLPVALLGFSQGGYLGSVAGANEPSLFSSVTSIGGRLKHEFFPQHGEYPPMLQLHGSEDFSVSPELAEEAIHKAEALGVSAEMRRFEGVGHEITKEMLHAFLEWEDAQK